MEKAGKHTMVEQEIFETYADNAFDEGTKENSITWKREWYNVNFKKFFPQDKNAKLLDIGPGLGELLITEKEWGYVNAAAIDISPSTTRYCNERGLECECVEDTATWLYAHPDTYDVITLLDVFEHVPQDETIDFLKACKAALKQKGILILQVPNIQSAESFLHRYNDITHVFGYSQHTLEQLISVVQFNTVKFYPFEEYPGDTAERKIVRRLRSIYWKVLSANREITHNLNPEIVTPELFAVLSKEQVDLPDNTIEDEFADNQISLEDMKHYLEKIGVTSEALDKVCKIDELEIGLREKERQLEISFREREKGLETRIGKLEEELKNKEQSLIYKIEEQNGRLVCFVDERVERLDQHNEWTRKRLDALERFRDRIKHPFKFLYKR